MSFGLSFIKRVAPPKKSVKDIGAVILGGDFQGLGIIHCLSEHNVPVFLVDYEYSISKFSRYVKRNDTNYRLLDETHFTDYLINLAKVYNLKGWVLYPTKDEMLKIISINLAKLKEWFRVPLPDWEIVQKFYYKENAYRIANNISISIPKIYQHRKLDDLLKQELSFPLVLKPSNKEIYYIKTKKKAVRVNNQAELLKEYKSMNSIIDSYEIVVQEMIEGGPRNLYSYGTFFDGEKCIAGITARRLRQHPMDFGHATTYAESVCIPEIEEMAEKLLKEIGYFGIAEVEFMWDNKENVYKFIEINGRFWGWHTLAREAGINFPYILYNFMLGEKISIHSSPRIGAKWIRLLTDTPTVISEILGGRLLLKDYFNTLKGKKRDAVFTFKDPLPFFIELIMIPYLWFKRGF